MRALWLLLGGCGRLGFSPLSGDAAVGDAPLADVAPDAFDPPTGPFGPATMVAGLGGADSNDDPSMTGDLLELFFESDRNAGLGSGDLWVATRMLATDTFGAPTNLAIFNTTGDDVTPNISADGLTLYFSSRRPGALGAAPNKDLYVSTRPTRTGAWSAPMTIEASRTADDVSPSVTSDQRRLYFVSTAASDDLFLSTRATATDPWGVAAPIVELSSTAEDSGPSINITETFIVFASRRTPTAGGSDLWSARRASVTAAWDPPQPLGELNTAADETDPWLSPDEHTLVFARGNNLFIATR